MRLRSQKVSDALADKKQQKKEKKKRSKEQQAEQQAEQEQQAVQRPKKKLKAAAAATSREQQTLAAVGDRSLAASRPPLVKALYTEGAEVAATSAAEVAAWREERRIALENADVKPITKFAQSGGCPFVLALVSMYLY